MARILTFALCLLSYICHGQNKTDLLQIELSNWEIKPKGNVKTVSYLLKSSNNVSKDNRQYEKAIASYSQNGDITKYSTIYSIGSEKNVNYSREFKYNTDGKISSTIYNSPKMLVKIEWHYDSLNNGYEKISYYPGNTWKQKVVFSNYGNLITSIISQEKSDNIKTIAQINGDTTTTSTFFVNGRLSYKSIEIKKDTITNITYSSLNNEGKIWQEGKTIITQALSVNESVTKHPDGTETKRKESSHFNIYNDCTNILVEEVTGNLVKYTSWQYVYEYDSKGNFIKKSCFVNEIKMWELKREIEYY